MVALNDDCLNLYAYGLATTALKMKLIRSLALVATIIVAMASAQQHPPHNHGGGKDGHHHRQMQTVVDGTLGAGVHALKENVFYLKKRVYSTGMWVYGASHYIGSPVARIGYPRTMSGEEQQVEVKATGEAAPYYTASYESSANLHAEDVQPTADKPIDGAQLAPADATAPAKASAATVDKVEDKNAEKVVESKVESAQPRNDNVRKLRGQK